jgi:DNA-binding transcriptional ArsR family regulator
LLKSPTETNRQNSMKPEQVLTGRTMEVYMYLVKQSSPVGVRQLQRAMKFSSPSGASHHLEKLERAGLVERTMEGEYLVKQLVEVGALKHFLRIRGKVVPRQIFYSLFFGVWLLEYSEYTGFKPNPIAFIALLAATIAFSYEAFRSWRKGYL